MEAPNPLRTLHPLNTDINPFHRGQVECTIQELTAKFFLNQNLEDLIPARYLRLARQTATATRKAWIFRGGAEDARTVNMDEWSKVDIRYRGVFKTLPKCPQFTKGLWEGGCEDCQDELNSGRPKTQAQAIYALLSEISEMLGLKRETYDGDAVFSLTPRLLSHQMEYWTGYRQKYKDAPETAGFLSLEFSPHSWTGHTILPMSTTTKEQTLRSALGDKFKIILGQLLLHLRYLPLPGDKLPDQEIFLIGLHGSKLHLMRAFFPGQKISSLWCRREIPSPAPTFSSDRVQILRTLSPETPHSTHIEDTNHEEYLLGIQSSSTEGISTQTPDSSRFYAAKNMERVRQQLEDTKMEQLDYEPDLRTFRVLATHEFDLWLRQDFAAAVHMLVALHLYLLGGTAQCGTLQQVFEKHPYSGDGSSPDNGCGVEPQRDSTLYQDWQREEKNFEEKEEELRREELIQRQEDAEAHQRREVMRNTEGDRIGSLHDARRQWWDFVWQDEDDPFSAKPKSTEGEDEESDMIVGNVDS